MGQHQRWAACVRLALVIAAIGAVAACTAGRAVDSGAAPVRVQPQRDWSDAVLYFVIVDRFADGDPANNPGVEPDNPGGWHGGDLRGLTAQLDEIASLGATALWITPVVKQIDYAPFAQAPPEAGGGSFEHHAFHGYWADDFTLVDARFGDVQALRALVDAAHARGMKVLLDVVYNHAGYGSRYETEERYRGWIRKRPVDCGADPLTCQVGGLPDFRTELPEVRKYLLDATIGLARSSGLDGFRLDTVKHVEHDFWREHRERTRAALGGDFFLLGEVWGGDARVLDEWFAPDELDAGFDFGFKGGCQSFVLGRGRTVAYAAYLEKRHRVRDGHLLAHYLSTHDEPMALHELGGDLDRFKLCVALQLTSLGIPVIYYGEEVGRRGSVWPTNRADMPWGSRAVEPGRGIARDEALRQYYRGLIGLRRTHPALSRGGFRPLSTAGDLLVFAREDTASGDAAIVAINRGAAPATATVAAPPAWGEAATEALGGRAAALESGELRIAIPARSAQVYVKSGTQRRTGAVDTGSRAN